MLLSIVNQNKFYKQYIKNAHYNKTFKLCSKNLKTPKKHVHWQHVENVHKLWECNMNSNKWSDILTDGEIHFAPYTKHNNHIYITTWLKKSNYTEGKCILKWKITSWIAHLKYYAVSWYKYKHRNNEMFLIHNI